jgi:uncharacterized membrane protein (DUF373 family)
MRFLGASVQWLTTLLAIGVLILIVRELIELFVVELWNFEAYTILGSIIATFLLIKIYGIFHSFLLQGYLKVERVVEVGIIAIVQEIIVHALTIDHLKLYALSVLLLALGGLFYLEKRFSNERNPDVQSNGRK